ncbi:MAG: SDR family NAD(P)-dependent oxidoreductase [Deltaproteobacteria bacterium]|mgnify:CR=1 FL=1|jgi:short-subunit dehydrogenase|nr:SDR family NAD(P)-dependent oxidoreductase [Deltaproteobacteria bacterium]MBT4639748.1 SDR family NAD(P)-dependent oxidoreductase [Deltaproteobacteria bacterium]
MKRFPEKRIVITGAGSGLGKTLAIDFAKMGWRVVVSSRTQSRIDQTVHDIKEAGGTVLGVQCDVSEYDNVAALADKVVAEWGGVDIVINNAGVPSGGYVETFSLEDWKWIMDINLMGTIHGCKAFIPILKKQGSGHIANVSSAAGFTSMAEMAPYNVTKAGIISLSETLKMELYGENIGVTVAVPTFFQTNLLENVRYTDEIQLKRAEAYFEKAFCDVNHVSKKLIKGIKKNKLYVLPQIDARFYWRFKRFAPELFFKTLAVSYHKGWIDKYLGV